MMDEDTLTIAGGYNPFVPKDFGKRDYGNVEGFFEEGDTKRRTVGGYNYVSDAETKDSPETKPYWHYQKKTKYTRKYKKMPARKAYKRRTYKRRSYIRNSKTFLNKETGLYELKPWVNSDPDNYVPEQFGRSFKNSTPSQKMNRMNAGYRGRGGYSPMVGGQGAYSVGKGLRALGGYAKSVRNIGRTLGTNKMTTSVAQAAADRAILGMGLYSGQGDYVSNALMDGGAPSMTIHGQSDETDDITITQEEYVRPIYAPLVAPGTSSGFNAQIIEVNPGLQNLAPKLAAIAANYVHYEIGQLVFRFKSKINESNVNNGISGDIMATFNYDPANDSYDSVSDVMQSSGKAIGRIVDNLEVGVEVDPDKSKETKYFTRTCPVPLLRDIDEFDHGNLLIATNNIPSNFSNLAIGDLYIYYTITLKQFKPGSSKLNNQQKDYFVCSADRTEAAVFYNAATPSTSLDKAACVAQQSNIGGRLSSPAAGFLTYTFPADVEGFFEVKLMYEGTLLTRTQVTPSVTGNVDFINDIYGADPIAGDTPSSMSYSLNALSCIAITHVRVRAATTITNNSLTFQPILGAGTGTITQWALDVSEITQNLWQKRSIQVPRFLNLDSGLATTV